MSQPRRPTKSGLVEALNSAGKSASPSKPNRYDEPQTQAPEPLINCGGRDCQGNKVAKRYFNGHDGAFEWITERATNRDQKLIVIRTSGGDVLGHLCQECYDRHLYQLQKGRLSHIQRDAEMITPAMLRAYDPTKDRDIDKELNPRGKPQSTLAFRRHLSELDALADRLASQQGEPDASRPD